MVTNIIYLILLTGIRSELYDTDTLTALKKVSFPTTYLRFYFVKFYLSWPLNVYGVPCGSQENYDRGTTCGVYPAYECGSYSAKGKSYYIEPFVVVTTNFLVEVPQDYKCRREFSVAYLYRLDGVFVSKKTIFSSSMHNNEYKTEFSPSDQNDNTFGYEILQYCSHGFGPGCVRECTPPSPFHRCRDSDGILECIYGYVGKNCDTRISGCVFNPCYNNGKCLKTDYAYQCECIGGYTGSNCEIQACDESTCLSGMCVSYSTDCQCPVGTSNVNCIKKSCPDDYCLNNGTCISTDLLFYCECKPGFLGEICQHKCHPTCVHGECIIKDNKPECLCEPSFTGKDCNTPTTSEACTNNNCINGGACQKSSHSLGYTCSCTRDWMGTYCEVPTCNATNCINGLCANNNECKCVSGYSGIRCDLLTCRGSDICLNGGTCVESSAYDLSCVCTNDYTGINCEQMCLGGCGEYGKCVESSYGYTCECDPFHEGRNCDELIDNSACRFSSCQNGGVCIENQRSFSCQCPDYWSGSKCTIPTCTSSICINGLCMEGVGCVCYRNYTGVRCESIVCPDDYCNNGGYCVSDGYTLSCECDHNRFSGNTCQYQCTEICVNGRCMETFAQTAKCQCDPGFTGKACDMRDISTLLTYLFGALTGVSIIIFLVSLTIYFIAVKFYIPDQDIRKLRLDTKGISEEIAAQGDLYARSRQ